MPAVSAQILHRYTAPMQVVNPLLHRYRGGGGVSKRILHRYANDGFSAQILHRYSSYQKLPAKQFVHRYSAFPQEVAGPSGSPVGRYEKAWKYGCGDLEVTLNVFIDGVPTDLSGIPSVLQVTHNESAPISWSLTIVDPNGDYHPKKAGAWNGVLDADAYTPTDGYKKKLVANIKWGGHEYNLIGIPNRFGHTRSFQTAGKFDFTWAGLDISAKLFRRAQTLPTLRSERAGVIWTNVMALYDLAQTYGLSADFSRVTPERIRVQHRQDGRAGDWMQALLEVTLAEWRVEGETLVGYQPAHSGPVQWVYDSSALLYEDQLDGSAASVINKVTVRRAAEGGKQPAQGDDGESIKVNNFGQYSQSFNPPLNHVMWRNPPTAGGAFSDFIFRNKDGVIIAVRDPRSGAGSESGSFWPSYLLTSAVIGAASVTFTWGAVPGFVGGGFPSSIEFFGNDGDHVGDGVTTPLDPVYTVTQSDFASIDKYGTWPVELSPNPLFFDSGVLTRFAVEYLRRKAWDLDPCSYRAPLNIAMRVGDRVTIVDDVLGISETRYVNQVTHSISDFPDQRFTRFNTIWYRDSG